MELLSIIAIVVGVLQIILFFKLWGMTDDVRAIKRKYMETQSPVDEEITPYPECDPDAEFQINDIVISMRTGKKMIVKERTKDGLYSCYIESHSYMTNERMKHEGDFSVGEIKLFGSK
jgi:uncharacterized protein YodC (DUF2158 family)